MLARQYTRIFFPDLQGTTQCVRLSEDNVQRQEKSEAVSCAKGKKSGQAFKIVLKTNSNFSIQCSLLYNLEGLHTIMHVDHYESIPNSTVLHYIYTCKI